MSRSYTWDIDPSGGSEGDVPTLDADGKYVPAPPAATGATGAAGGVLSGTYPNPGFATDMATQAELDAVAASAPVAASDLTTTFIPLVTTVGGVPQLVFDANDNLVLTEVPV